MVIGGWVVKNIHSWKFRAATKQNITVRSFAVAKTTDMGDCTIPAIHENANIYVIHCGTNYLHIERSSEDIADNVISLADKIQSKNRHFLISGLYQWGDEYCN